MAGSSSDLIVMLTLLAIVGAIAYGIVEFQKRYGSGPTVGLSLGIAAVYIIFAWGLMKK